MSDKIICVLCPKGCSIEKINNGEKSDYVGYGCKRGYEYAKDEFSQPKRILTTVVRIVDGEIECLPVRTDKPIPKKLIFDAMSYLKKIEKKAPVKVGDVIVKDLLNTGSDVIATRDVNKKSIV